MPQPTMSSVCFDALSYFASGCIVYNDRLPNENLSWEIISLLVERKYIKKMPINPNDMISYYENPECEFYYAISEEGKEAFYLEKEIQQRLAKQEKSDQEEQRRANNMQAVQDKKQQLRHDFSVAAFSELVAIGLSHLIPNAINLVKAFIKAFFRH